MSEQLIVNMEDVVNWTFTSKSTGDRYCTSVTLSLDGFFLTLTGSEAKKFSIVTDPSLLSCKRAHTLILLCGQVGVFTNPSFIIARC